MAAGLVHHIMEKLKMAAEICLFLNKTKKNLKDYYSVESVAIEKGSQLFLYVFIYFLSVSFVPSPSMSDDTQQKTHNIKTHLCGLVGGKCKKPLVVFVFSFFFVVVGQVLELSWKLIDVERTTLLITGINVGRMLSFWI